MRAYVALAIGCASLLVACDGCRKDGSGAEADAGADAASKSPAAVAEVLPRCRPDGARLPLPGEELVVGDVAVGPAGLLVGVVRRAGDKRVASVVSVPFDLSSSQVIDVGPAVGDDPAPSPRFAGDARYAAYVVRRATDAGSGILRELSLARLEQAALGKVEATIVQQADESTAFDVAFPEGGGPALVAWDEDAPPAADAGSAPVTSIRGFVKVQSLVDGGRPRVASPETSDADSPRLVTRPGGFWLAWLARRVEEEQPGMPEGPGERRAFRWVELVQLDARGEAVSPVRRISPDKGRVVSFELARPPDQDDGHSLIVLVQDEAASAEGQGARILRYLVSSAKVDAADVVDGGVGHAIAELVPVPSSPPAAARWLSWTDTNERAHMTPLAAELLARDRDTAEPTFDSARVLAASSMAQSTSDAGGAAGQRNPERADFVFALVDGSVLGDGAGRPELRRFSCR